MLNLPYILFSQYPALLLLSLLFLIANLRQRKKSTVKSILWSILFAISLAAAIVLCFLGLHAGYWALNTLLSLSAWSWCGIVLVVFFMLLRIAHGIESSLHRRKLNRELKKAEKDKEAAVEQAREKAREEGREEARAEAMSASAAMPSEDAAANAASSAAEPDAAPEAAQSDAAEAES